MKHTTTKQDIQTYCAVILTNKSQQYQSLQMHPGVSYHIKLCVQLLVDGVPLTVAAGEVVSTPGSGGRLQDQGQRLSSAGTIQTKLSSQRQDFKRQSCRNLYL